MSSHPTRLQLCMVLQPLQRDERKEASKSCPGFRAQIRDGCPAPRHEFGMNIARPFLMTHIIAYHINAVMLIAFSWSNMHTGFFCWDLMYQDMPAVPSTCTCSIEISQHCIDTVTKPRLNSCSASCVDQTATKSTVSVVVIVTLTTATIRLLNGNKLHQLAQC